MSTFSFKINIKHYDKNEFTYLVEYIPDDTRLSPISFSIRINPLEHNTPELILEIIKKSSPQFYWNEQIKSITTDHTTFESLVGKKEAVTSQQFAELINTNQTSTEIPKVLTDEQINQYINSVLKSQG